MVHRNPKFHHLKGFGKNRCVDHGICQVRAPRIRGSEWGLWKRYVREYTTKLRSCTMHPSRVLKFPLEIELKEVQKASAIFGKCHQSHLCPIELQLNFHSLDLNFKKFPFESILILDLLIRDPKKNQIQSHLHLQNRFPSKNRGFSIGKSRKKSEVPSKWGGLCWIKRLDFRHSMGPTLWREDVWEKKRTKKMGNIGNR